MVLGVAEGHRGEIRPAEVGPDAIDLRRVAAGDEQPLLF